MAKYPLRLFQNLINALVFDLPLLTGMKNKNERNERRGCACVYIASVPNSPSDSSIAGRRICLLRKYCSSSPSVIERTKGKCVNFFPLPFRAWFLFLCRRERGVFFSRIPSCELHGTESGVSRDTFSALSMGYRPRLHHVQLSWKGTRQVTACPPGCSQEEEEEKACFFPLCDCDGKGLEERVRGEGKEKGWLGKRSHAKRARGRKEEQSYTSGVSVFREKGIRNALEFRWQSPGYRIWN